MICSKRGLPAYLLNLEQFARIKGGGGCRSDALDKIHSFRSLVAVSKQSMRDVIGNAQQCYRTHCHFQDYRGVIHGAKSLKLSVRKRLDCIPLPPLFATC